MKINEKELMQHQEYWLEMVQNNLYVKLRDYMKDNDLNQNQLAEELGFSKGYVSQIMNGNFNFSMSKFIDLALATDHYPKVSFVKKNPVKESKTKVIDLYTKKPRKKVNIHFSNTAVNE